eukprot:Hpha_TRINITY_DN15430_c0_g1::TRINITY_DN15430_c0_g1_i1::g.175205::m.175205
MEKTRAGSSLQLRSCSGDGSHHTSFRRSGNCTPSAAMQTASNSASARWARKRAFCNADSREAISAAYASLISPWLMTFRTRTGSSIAQGVVRVDSPGSTPARARSCGAKSCEIVSWWARGSMERRSASLARSFSASRNLVRSSVFSICRREANSFASAASRHSFALSSAYSARSCRNSSSSSCSSEISWRRSLASCVRLWSGLFALRSAFIALARNFSESSKAVCSCRSRSRSTVELLSSSLLNVSERSDNSATASSARKWPSDSAPPPRSGGVECNGCTLGAAAWWCGSTGVCPAGAGRAGGGGGGGTARGGGWCCGHLGGLVDLLSKTGTPIFATSTGCKYPHPQRACTTTDCDITLPSLHHANTKKYRN